VGQCRDGHSLGHLDLVRIQGVIETHPRQIELDVFGQVLRQADHFDVGHMVGDHAALGLDTGRRGLALEVDRQVQTDLLVLQHALQIDVHDSIARRVHLHVLDDDGLLLGPDLDVDDRGVELLVADQRQQFVMLEREPRGLGVSAVENGGNHAGMTQAAARTLALLITRFRAEFESNTHLMLLND